MTDDLLELAERCEAAEGADRELAKDIFRAIFPDKVPAKIVTAGYGWREDEGGWWLATGGDARTPPQTISPPKWLTSLDAALTLKEGSGVLITLSEIKGDGMPYCVIGNPETAELFEATASTPALALVAACLKARATQGENDG
jgi:hypothetical protein